MMTNDVFNFLFGVFGNVPERLTKLPGGLTNNSYSFFINNENYVLRVPGEGTNEFINRKSEILNLNRAEELGIAPKIIFSSDGWLITKFYRNIEYSKTEIFENEELLEMIINCLKKLHTSNLQFDDFFDIEKEILKYQSLIVEKKIQISDEVLEIEKIIKEKDYKLNQKIKKIPCHNDPKLSNFLFANNRTILIDWEYSNQASVYFELANFVLTNHLDKNEEHKFIERYIKSAKLKFDKREYILYKILTDFLWMYWHLIKLNQNEDAVYNDAMWRIRLKRANDNMKNLEGV